MLNVNFLLLRLLYAGRFNKLLIRNIVYTYNITILATEFSTGSRKSLTKTPRKWRAENLGAEKLGVFFCSASTSLFSSGSFLHLVVKKLLAFEDWMLNGEITAAPLSSTLKEFDVKGSARQWCTYYLVTCAKWMGSKI